MPREKLLEKGAINLRDRELLAILLRTGTREKNVLQLADGIITKHPLKDLVKMGISEFTDIRGLGPEKICTLLAAFEIAKRALEIEDNNLPVIKKAQDAVAQLQELRSARKEHFVVLYLNARNQLVRKETISIGTLNASLVHPREVFKPAIDHLAASIVAAHNHPSGDAEPSGNDLELTQRLRDAGRLLGVELLDHLIITHNSFNSIMGVLD